MRERKGTIYHSKGRHYKLITPEDCPKNYEFCVKRKGMHQWCIYYEDHVVVKDNEVLIECSVSNSVEFIVSDE